VGGVVEGLVDVGDHVVVERDELAADALGVVGGGVVVGQAFAQFGDSCPGGLKAAGAALFVASDVVVGQGSSGGRPAALAARGGQRGLRWA
jgi:hypothetical protein